MFIGIMARVRILAFLFAGCMPLLVSAQESSIKPLLDTTKPVEKAQQGGSRVTAVYGISTEDYLPIQQLARQHLRPNIRASGSRPSFRLPDVFYFVGGPIILITLLRVIVIFLNGFEEERKEEQRLATSENSRREQG